eukprot:TRINITY_DN839_c0_g2_i1.p1 TRINITY_DN839_c0_g2~~TRINITY_DN839_c0_g2_i1.p1  ORF type:complete len:407 (+),score=79.54 TRINITY_DN839_c0_g2_i1:148-1368(+)
MNKPARKGTTAENIEDVNKRCRVRHQELKDAFYKSLSSSPVQYPPDLEDNAVWSPELGLAPGTDKANLPPNAWADADAYPDINTLLTRREQAYFSDKQIYCHLRARGWDLVKANEMIRETLRWRREAKPYGITCDEVENHLKSSKNYTLGWTVKHQPTVILRCRYDVPGDNPGKIKTILFQMERLLRLVRARNLLCMDCTDPADLRDTPPHEQVALIFDCKGFAKKDIDVPLTKELARVLDHYPETLGVVFAVDTPFIFRAFWKMTRTFLDEKTVKKINFVSGNEGRSKIFPLHYQPEELESCFGGQNNYRYNHEAYFDLLRKEAAEGITILEQPEAGSMSRGTSSSTVPARGEGGGGAAGGEVVDIDYQIGEYAEELSSEDESHEGDADNSGDKKAKKKDKSSKK